MKNSKAVAMVAVCGTVIAAAGIVAAVVLNNNTSATENSAQNSTATVISISAEEQIFYQKLIQEREELKQKYYNELIDSDLYSEMENKAAEVSFEAENMVHNDMLSKVIDILDRSGKNEKQITTNDKSFDNYRSLIEDCIDLYKNGSDKLTVEEKMRLRMELTYAYTSFKDPANDPDGHSAELGSQISELIYGADFEKDYSSSGNNNETDLTVRQQVSQKWAERMLEIKSELSANSEYADMNDEDLLEIADNMQAAERRREAVAIIQRFITFTPIEGLYDKNAPDYDTAHRLFADACKDTIDSFGGALTAEEKYLLSYEAEH